MLHHITSFSYIVSPKKCGAFATVCSLMARGVYNVQVFQGFIIAISSVKTETLEIKISDDGVEKPNHISRTHQKLEKFAIVKPEIEMDIELESGVEKGHEARRSHRAGQALQPLRSRRQRSS